MAVCLHTAPVCAQVLIPLPSRGLLSGFGKRKSDFLNYLNRENTHTHTHADRACLAHTAQLAFHLTTGGRGELQTDMSVWVAPSKHQQHPSRSYNLSVHMGTMLAFCQCFGWKQVCKGWRLSPGDDLSVWLIPEIAETEARGLVTVTNFLSSRSCSVNKLHRSNSRSSGTLQLKAFPAGWK